jgi:hypothetical protein
MPDTAAGFNQPRQAMRGKRKTMKKYPDMTTVLFVGEHTFAVEPVVTADGDFYRVVHVESGEFLGFAHGMLDGKCIAKEWINERETKLARQGRRAGAASDC